ncbi:MAG TPA: protein-export chaperone SecB [Solimonas sp.]|nr:protein-export chaperone SecB [Solimonas sp.]
MSETPSNPTAPAAGTAPAARQVLLQKIYVKDASLEVPLAPQVFTRPWQPQVDVQVNTDVKPLEGDNFHLVLALTVTVKLGEDVAFLAEAHQAAIFNVRGFDNRDELQAILGAYCPAQVFPFARETVADLVQRAGFPQLLLQPINFEALYVDHLNKRRAQAAAAATATAH